MAKTLQGAIGAVLAVFFISLPVLAAPPYVWPNYSVVPIFFSPTDWGVNSKKVKHEAAQLRLALKDIQAFYRNQLSGGRTFRLNALQVVQGNRAKEGYGITWGTGNIYAEGTIRVDATFEDIIIRELYARGYPTPPSQNENGYVALIFVKGAGGWAGGRSFRPGSDGIPRFGGWSLMGDWAIDSIEGDVPMKDYLWSGKSRQIAAATMMLGAAFGVPIPSVYGGDPATTIMGDWKTPGIGFNQHDVDYLKASKAQFFP